MLGTCKGYKNFIMTNSKGTFKYFGAQRPALSCISKKKVKHLQSKVKQEFKPKELISVTDLWNHTLHPYFSFCGKDTNLVSCFFSIMLHFILVSLLNGTVLTQ